MDRIDSVPTNIITGFLGVGKTTAILHLLKSKPKSERWAVLVNEFGEVGVDGSLFSGSNPEEQNVFIREVPGGCMCCASGLPMQIALNMLLTQAKPDRLLIEPTGLGHPKEVLDVLSAEYYREVLTLNKTISLVDARKLSDPRYTEHDTFNQQIEIADVVVGNKVDLYQQDENQALNAYIEERQYRNKTIVFTTQAKLALDLLEGSTAYETSTAAHKHHGEAAYDINQEEIPESGFLTVTNKGEGFSSIGWRFAPDLIFDKNALFGFLCGLNVERMKAVFITQHGVMGYNLTSDALSEFELDDCGESCIEIIARETDPSWQEALLACRIQL